MPHAALPVGEGPEDVFGAAVVCGLVGEKLVDGRAPEIAVGEVGGRVAVELEDGLVAVVGPEGVGGRAGAVAVGIELLVDQAVEGAVFVVDGLGGRTAVGGPVGYASEAVAVVPGVLRDRRVARVECSAGIGVDVSRRAVPVVVVRVRIRPVGREAVVVAGRVAGVGAVAGVVVRMRLVSGANTSETPVSTSSMQRFADGVVCTGVGCPVAIRTANK